MFEKLADLLARNRNVRRFRLRSAHQRFAIIAQHRNTLLLQMAAPAILRASAPKRLVDGDPSEPGREARTAFERANICECRKIGSLNGFLGVRAALEYAPSGSEQPLVV